MAVSENLLQFVLDQLSAFGEVETKKLSVASAGPAEATNQ
jgi:hypothetical protein